MEATHDKYNRGNYSVGRTYRTGNYRLPGTVGSVISGSFFFSEKEGEPESDPEPCGISTGACGSGIAAIASGDSDSGAVEKSVFMEENCVKRKFVNRSIHKKSEKRTFCYQREQSQSLPAVQAAGRRKGMVHL